MSLVNNTDDKKDNNNNNICSLVSTSQLSQSNSTLKKFTKSITNNIVSKKIQLVYN
jgi:hypothetical protein